MMNSSLIPCECQDATVDGGGCGDCQSCISAWDLSSSNSAMQPLCSSSPLVISRKQPLPSSLDNMTEDQLRSALASLLLQSQHQLEEAQSPAVASSSSSFLEESHPHQSQSFYGLEEMQRSFEQGRTTTSHSLSLPPSSLSSTQQQVILPYQTSSNSDLQPQQGNHHQQTPTRSNNTLIVFSRGILNDMH
jgi:hypothetical protein